MSANKILANHAFKAYDFDPDSADPVDVAWVDMRDFDGFAVAFVRTVGTGALDGFKILANDESDGSGTDVTIATHAVGSEPDAVGDQIWLEVTAAEVRAACDAAGVAGRYVSASLEFATATDEGVVFYVRSRAKRAYDGLTADAVA